MKFFVLRNKETGKYLKSTNNGTPMWIDGFDPALKKHHAGEAHAIKTTILGAFEQRKTALQAFVDTPIEIEEPILEIVQFETHEVGVVHVKGETQ